MEILIGFEHNYVMPYGVMLQSLVHNNTKEIIHVHAIINESVTDDDKNVLSQIVRQYDRKNDIFYYLFDKNTISSFPLSSVNHFREVCYYRLFAASILPTEIEKVLYLDGDMVIRHDLSELWKLDVNEVAVAGAINQTEKVDYYNRLHYPMKKKYINNGVAVFNLKYWRENGCEEAFTKMIIDYPERIFMADQDVMNFVLQDSKKLIPIKFNVQENFYYKLEFMSFDYWGHKDEVESAIIDPWILHFAGKAKPWIRDCKHPLKGEFFKYQDMTIWKGMSLQEKYNQSYKTKIKSHIKYILGVLKIMEPEKEINKFKDYVKLIG